MTTFYGKTAVQNFYEGKNVWVSLADREICLGVYPTGDFYPLSVIEARAAGYALIAAAQVRAPQPRVSISSVTDLNGMKIELATSRLLYDGLLGTYKDIAANLGANIPFELVNEVARCRMGEITDLQRQLADAIRERDQYKAACEMATALRPLGAVQVVEGGAAVLLDTSKGAT